MFDQVTEIDFPQPSHLDNKRGKLIKINRMFSSVSKSSLSLMKHKAGIMRDPTWYHARNLSDHAPIFWVIDACTPKPAKFLRIEPEWVRHSAYKPHSVRLCACVHWEGLSLNERSITLKEFM